MYTVLYPLFLNKAVREFFFIFNEKKKREGVSGGRCLGSLSSSISLFHDLKCDLTLPSLNFSLCKMEVTVLAFSQDCWNIKWNNVCKTPGKWCRISFVVALAMFAKWTDKYNSWELYSPQKYLEKRCWINLKKKKVVKSGESHIVPINGQKKKKWPTSLISCPFCKHVIELHGLLSPETTGLFPNP